MEIKTLKFLPEDVQDEGIITGYASTSKRDADGDVIEAGAFAKTISEGSDGWPFLWMHDVKSPVGLVSALEYDGKGIRFTAELDLDTPEGKRVYSGLKKKYIDRTSVGFKTVKAQYDKATKTRHIQEIKLYELSAVTKGFSANDEALVTGVKSLSTLVEEIQSLNGEELTPDQLKASITHLQTLLESKTLEPSNDTQDDEQPSDDTVSEMRLLIERLRNTLS